MERNRIKEKLIAEFTTMKEMEIAAQNMYSKIAEDKTVEDQNIKITFKNIAADELRHAELVDKIINIISNCL